MHIRIIFEIFEKYKCADIVFSSKALHMILVNLCAQLCPTLCNRMEMWPASLLCIWNFFFFFFWVYMEFLRQEYWNGLPFLTPGDLSNLGIEPMSLVSPA